ncbi:FAD/NAD(P)-binding domain-containing protein [Teratosphaeria nubilosa]|uniref:FAD/NAD(P)-binding domain-containing protein n=1 Tax=Teratosphaeria nubilosa TaxID=161662 RepID=A0A6G1KXQ1_9PEZI|nr:FAD/NAD(P)-binding domain-containing protein [Teratosphaeria nubilosa]
MPPLKIAIIGAGPAGCTLARLLLSCPQTRDLTCTIFEAESSPNFRSQGGTLDLHTRTGQAALKAGGLWDEFLKHARYDGEAIKIADKNLLCYVNIGGGKVGSKGTGRPEIDRPEIDRPVLREMLYESLPEGTVRWDKKLVSVTATPPASSKHSLNFADGSTESGFDLIVGADGAWSKVRRLLTDEQPFYSGIAGHQCSIPDARQNASELFDLVNRGSLFTWSDGKGLFIQYMGDGSINSSTWSRRDVDWQKAYDVHDAAVVKEVCRKEYADWDSRLVDCVLKADNSTFVPRDLFMLPIDIRWDGVPGVTVIGDAAHVMTPFAGEGVNLAMEDSLRLSEAILKSVDTPRQLASNVRAFEDDMFVRARKTQQATYDMMAAIYHTPGSPRRGIERYVLKAMENEMGWWMMILVTPIVYVWFGVFKMIW